MYLIDKILHLLDKLETGKFNISFVGNEIPIDLFSLVMNHYLVDDIKFLDPSHLKAQGRCIKNQNDKFDIFCDPALLSLREFEIPGRPRIPGGKYNLGRISRAKFTLAHEYAHILLADQNLNLEQYLLDSNGKLSEKTVELFCEMAASSLLLPRQALLNLCDKYHGSLPMDAFISIAKKAQVNLVPLLRRMAQTGITSELPWLIAMFEYTASPHKSEPFRWRLKPGCLVLPRGIRCSKRRIDSYNKSRNENRWLPDLGYWHVGLDTFGFSNNAIAIERDYNKVSRYYLKMSKVNNELPWDDLNQPNTRSKVPDKNRLKINLEPKQDKNTPVASALLEPFENWENHGKKGENLFWKISVIDLRGIGYKAPNEKPKLFLSGRLKITRRRL